MRRPDFGDAILSLKPGAPYTLSGDDLSTLQWHDDTQARPSNAEIIAERDRLRAAPQVFVVTPRQARLALLRAGLLDNVETNVNGAGPATKIAWDFAKEIRSNDPIVSTLLATLNLTQDQITALFLQASEI